MPKPVPVPVPRPIHDEPQNNGPFIALGVAVGILLLILLMAMLRGCHDGGMGDSGDGHGGGMSGDMDGDTDGNDGNGQSDSNGRNESSSSTSQGTKDANQQEQKAGNESAKEESKSPSTSSSQQSESEQGDTGEKQKETNEENKSKTTKKTDEKDTKHSLADKLSGAVAEKDEPDETQEESKQRGGFLGKGDVEVSFFGAKGKGSKFVYVVDHSGSMAGAPMEEAKKEMTKGLDLLKEHHRFNIIFYDDRFISWTDGTLYPATDKNRKDAKQFVNRVLPAGGTVPEPALVHAMKAKPEYIFFLTDGEFSLNMDEVCAFANKNHVHINTVQFGGDSTPKNAQLQELAKRTNGDYRFVNVGKLDAL